MYASIELDPIYNQFQRYLLKVFLIFLIMIGSFYPSFILSSEKTANNVLMANFNLNNSYDKANKIIIKMPVLHFKRVAYLRRITAYNAVPWQTDSNPYVSACGPNLSHGQIAVSQNLFFKPDGGNRCGQQVIIHLANGQVIKGVVWDTMNARYYNAADILMTHIHQAVQFGIRQGSLTFVTSKMQKVNIGKYV